MPRPKVSEQYRRRIAKACLYCQTAKLKCDGLLPCVQCVKREKLTTCAYSSHERSYGSRRRRRRDVEARRSSTTATMDPSSPTPSHSSHEVNKASTVADITVPKISHNLYDVKGRVLYLGNCAALSFLQHIQELIDSEKGFSVVAADVSSLSVLEELPPVPCENVLADGTDSLADLQELVDVFFTSTCGILDIIERPHVEITLHRWANDPSSVSSGSAAVLYLIIAYAAQARSASPQDSRRTRSFYHQGRQIALLELTNDPILETIQAFILISLYMLGYSQRNGGFFNLGIAISAAKSLGCHRDETNDRFPEKEKRLRKRIWRTLRYHDMFFCAMMGRTSSTITTDSTTLPELQPLYNSSLPDFDQELGLMESAHAFLIMERIVKEIYTQHTVPLGLLQRLSIELQEASSNVPTELRTLEIPNSSHQSPHTSQRYILRNASVACNYYFSMMLLTRPFLITSLRAKCNRGRTEGRLKPEDSRIYTDIMQGAMASVDAAIKTIQLLYELLEAGMLFNNMPLFVAWTFVSALTICSAYFGQLGNLSENEHAIQQADEVLKHFTRNSLQARRYSLILTKLSKAALDYVSHLEHKQRVARNRLMPELFRLNTAQSEKVSNVRPGQSSNSQATNKLTALAPLPEGPPEFTFQMGSIGGKFLPTETLDTTHLVHEGKNRQHNDFLGGRGTSSLLHTAHTFNKVNNNLLDESLDFEEDYIQDSLLTLENTETIWDLNWGGALI